MGSSEERVPPKEEEEETLSLGGGKEQPPALVDESSNGPGENHEEEEEGSSSSAAKTLELATELFNKGSKAIEENDFIEAVDCLSRSLEISVVHYGELAPECVLSYYKYGCALLYKSQEEADPLGIVPRGAPRNLEKDKSPKYVGDSESSKASAGDTQECNASSNKEEMEDGASDKDQEDVNEGSDGDDEEVAEADEDDSDLDLAWKMLDVARVIADKCSEDKIEKVNIYAALGEVSMEREDFETSLNDYLKALSIMERLAEPDNRRIIELNFRICLVLEVWARVKEAIPYCEKAISLCKSRLKRLSEDVKLIALSDNSLNSVNNSGTDGNQASGKGDAEDEKEVVSGFLSELERKLEDLQHVMSNPKSDFSEIMKMIVTKSASSAETNITSITESRSASLNSSQMGVLNGGFDSPTISTAATNSSSNVTHLGVVGRGVKRASLNPIGDEQHSSKKLLLEPSSENDGSTVSEAVDS